ncbi:MAG: cytochrome c biogenesis protein CcsA [Anaerolineae bacterium]|nr:cytochrome c biogenesis protein CcsA [Anaerolineae bacterium]MDH7473588.1 cytochrome c biogenesis protein CcsA [Anaerolineae bacterium]
MRRWTAGLLVVLDVFSALSLTLGLYLALLWAPTEATMGHVQRIFYFHVPAAWVGFLAFFVTLIASVLYLWRRTWEWDIVAASSVGLGVAFSLMAICSGSIWARAAWNTWWTWDPRLTTTTVMLTIYIAYLMLRGALDDPARRARFAAVYGIVGFVSVPVTFMAIRWWRTIHPVILSSAGFELSPRMLVTLLVCVGAFTLFYFSLLGHCVRLELLADEVARLKKRRV